jgi:hypothetical protein
VQGIEIGNIVNPKDDSFAINELTCSTPRNEKSFANVSEVTGNSWIKMEGVAKPGERFQRPSPKAVVLRYTIPHRRH